MTGKGSLIAKILIIAGILAAAAALITVFCSKMKKEKARVEKKKDYDFEEEALKDFEECCDACFSECNE